MDFLTDPPPPQKKKNTKEKKVYWKKKKKKTVKAPKNKNSGGGRDRREVTAIVQSLKLPSDTEVRKAVAKWWHAERVFESLTPLDHLKVQFSYDKLLRQTPPTALSLSCCLFFSFSFYSKYNKKFKLRKATVALERKVLTASKQTDGPFLFVLLFSCLLF